MNTPEMQQESPEDIAQKIAELDLAKEDDGGIDGEAQIRLNTRKGALRKELHGMVSEEQGVNLVQAAKDRIIAEEEEAKKGLRIGTEESDDLEEAA